MLGRLDFCGELNRDCQRQKCTLYRYTALMAGVSLVHLASMPYAMHHNNLVIILNVADDTIVSSAKAPKSTHATLQHLRAA